MGTDGDAEACGRCSMTSVVGATGAGEGEEADPSRDPFARGSIEVDEDQLRAVSRHVIALGRLKSRLDRWATKLTYGR